MSISTPETGRNSLRHRLMDLMDPRSPTTEFQRTPIQIMVKKWNSSMSNKASLTDSGCEASTNDSAESNSISQNENNDTRSSTDVSYVSLDDISLDAIDLSDFDLSKMISQLNDSCTIDVDSVAKSNKTSPNLQNTDEDVVKCENETTPTVECSGIENEMSVKAEVVEPMKKVTNKNLFSTPTKKRTPLESVDNVCLSTPPSHLNSPQNSFREKQWKRIHEERKKLGLESNENLPIPLMDVTASAPSKLVYRKRTTDNKINLSKLM